VVAGKTSWGEGKSKRRRGKNKKKRGPPLQRKKEGQPEPSDWTPDFGIRKTGSSTNRKKGIGGALSKNEGTKEKRATDIEKISGGRR